MRLFPPSPRFLARLALLVLCVPPAGCGARTHLFVDTSATAPTDAGSAAPALDDASGDEASTGDPSAGPPGTVATGIAEIVAGYYHTCARWNDGLVRCWGDDEYGQLGDGRSSATCDVDGGTKSCRRSPQLVHGIPSVVQVAAGGNHTCVLGADGSVWCWGSNDAGQIGPAGTTPNQTSPVQVSGLSGVVEIATGGEHTCARSSSGVVSCWGNDLLGQLGDGTSTSRADPTPVQWLNGGATPYNAQSLALGRYDTCATQADGSAICWGDFWTLPTDTMPALVETSTVGSPVVSMGLGLDTTCLVTQQGLLWCTEFDGPDTPCGGGTLADGASTSGIWGLPLSQGTTAVATTSVAVGDSGFCARGVDGFVYCDGYEGNPNCLPPAWPPLAGVAQAAGVAAGYAHACALLEDQTVECWGQNDFGQLGQGTSTTPPPDPDGGDNQDDWPPSLVTW